MGPGLGLELKPIPALLVVEKSLRRKKEDVDGSDERRGILFHVLFFRIRTKEKVSSLYFIFFLATSSSLTVF